MSKILITGGNGLIGTRLQEMLLKRGHEVNTIGRKGDTDKTGKARKYVWDVKAGKMDARALNGVGAIVHLAGAGVADKRWTGERKKEIYDSRIDSTRLLYDTLASTGHKVRSIVSASAVGYYGDRGAEVLTEEDAPGGTFLAEVTSGWEAEVGRMEELGIRHVCCRIGIVLSRDGGALPELERTIPLGVAGYFAKEDLYYSWIHIDDVCGIMCHALENDKLRGSYNTTGPDPVRIKELMAAIVNARESKAVLMPVPPIALKIALGEMSEAVLQSQRCSDQKVINTGYKFLFPELEGALKNLYAK